MSLFVTSVPLSSSDSPLMEEATEKVNALTNYWNSLDWDLILAGLISKGVILLITCTLIFLTRRIGMTLIRRAFTTYKKNQNYSENRIETLYKLTSNSFQYFLYFILLYTILTLLGIPVGSLIAGAGIAGIAIGLGAQGFINDLLTGFFIILERQIDVGNHVKIDAIEGLVLAIGLRTTQIKDFDGTIHYIPNRNITIVSNLSRENMRVLIQLRIKPDADLEQLTQLIATVNTELTPRFPAIKSQPELLGVVDLGGGNLCLKVIMYTLNGSQLQIQAAFLEGYLKAFSEAGIEVPHSPLTMTTR